MTGFAQLVQTPIIPYFIWSHVTFASSNWHFDARTVHTNYVHGVAQYTHAHSDMLFWCQAKEVFVYFIVVKTVQEIIEARLCAGGRGVWNLLKNIEGFFFFFNLSPTRFIFLFPPLYFTELPPVPSSFAEWQLAALSFKNSVAAVFETIILFLP